MMCRQRIIAANVQGPQVSWFIGSTEGDQAVEVPVSFLYFTPLYHHLTI